MKLSELAALLPAARIVGDGDPEVTAVVDDSREASVGALFVAIPRSADGHRFAAGAVERGAVAVVAQREVDVDVPQVIVGDSAEAFGVLVSRMAGDPAHRLALVGITGTNGKTTITFLLEAILQAAGAALGVLGTVSYRFGGRTVDAPYTTPTPGILHRTFASMVDAGCSHAVMEVSSAALSMDRMAGLHFRVGAFTNLTQDHLDVHGDMDAYRAAKARLFADYLAPGGVAVINADDPAAVHMIAAAGEHRVLRVSTRADVAAEIRVTRADSSVDGIVATIDTPTGPIEVTSRALLGGYNISNIAVAIGVAEVLGVAHDAIARGIDTMPGVPGRVERVANGAGLDILVDYAHTPDALRNVLGAVRPLTRGRLICVFGCGGDRDPTKRSIMGAAVAELADLAVVTSDNPRTEEPQAIIDMILPAVPAPFFVDADRRTAIRAAVAEAVPGDIVVIAGKGHEDYQIVATDQGTKKIHFDDREEVAAAVTARWTLAAGEILEATGGQLVAGSDRTTFARAIIDGRAAAPGDLYVAIRGEIHDGHAFCTQAAEAGATGLLVDHAADLTALPPGITVIQVADTRVALGQIARIISRRWGLADPARRLVAITGSAGKTTTKELLRAALSAAGRVHASVGSLNNETGVPLTLLGLRDYHDYAVVEMGMRGLGQIAYLVDIAEPHVGVVVNAGTAHVGVVGSVEAIASGKAEIFGALPSYGCAVYPAGDPRLASHAASAPRRLTFGEEDDADVRLVHYRPAEADGADVRFRVDGREIAARVPLPGKHNAVNAACALAAAIAVGVDPEVAARGLASARAADMRGQVRVIGGQNVLVDCYNANPASMCAALDTLRELAGQRPAVAVLGDMLELGDEAADAHRTAGAQAAARNAHVIALGEHAGALADGARDAGGSAEVAADPAAAAAAVRTRAGAGDWVLVKASRGMRLERVVDALAEEAGQQ